VKKNVHDCLDLLADLANILLVVFLVSMHQSCSATLVITFAFSVVEWLNTSQREVQMGLHSRLVLVKHRSGMYILNT
jgi:hypothetical protein